MTDSFIPIADAINVAILMHRDAHFSGSFPVMLDYYREERRGVQPELTFEKIAALAEMEKQLGQNLAPLMLSGSEAEEVGASKAAYKNLRDLYEKASGDVDPYALLVADLILTDDPHAAREIAAIVKEKGAIVPHLLEILREDSFYNPLFPGYGQTPQSVMRCLGEIGDKRSIITLFEQIGSGNFFDEEAALEGLKKIGTPAKDFLIKMMKSQPITADNERAAIALLEFLDDLDSKERESIAHAALELLLREEGRRALPFANYLALLCAGLSEEKDRLQCMQLREDPKVPKTVRDDLKQITKKW